jgi:hypothetical protein
LTGYRDIVGLLFNLAVLLHENTLTHKRTLMTKQKQDAETLLQELYSPDWKMRRNAAQALGTARDMQAVEP